MFWALLVLFICVQAIEKGHSNNWAVIVGTSTFWFNYRHSSNALSIYSLIKQNGIPDDKIILMLADDAACNPRNPMMATCFNTDDTQSRVNVYGVDVEVDYRGSEVTVENFFRLLTDRLPHGTPRSKRLLSDDRSNIILFMTGHGGDNFLKFQDSEEINAHDLADALEQMHQHGRFNEMLVIIDTCQASTMFDQIRVPNVITIASSSKGESSYSYHVDDQIGVAVIDRFTFAALDFLTKALPQGDKTLQDFRDSWDPVFLHSHPKLDTSRLGKRRFLLSDYFSSRQRVLAPDVTRAASDLGAGQGELRRPVWSGNNPRLLIDKPLVSVTRHVGMKAIL